MIREALSRVADNASRLLWAFNLLDIAKPSGNYKTIGKLSKSLHSDPEHLV